MTKDNTMKNKSQLAKLLATENIEVQENQVQTASFDVVQRILTIPIFKEEQKSKHVYDMLVGHEVSHALYTPSDSWKEMAKRTKEFKSFVNVIEDARIDKLIQKKYPGLVDDYLKGFDKMYKDNFFGTKGKDIMTYALIDKINLYYKSSKRLDFKFTNKEKILVNAVDKCKSFDDVCNLAEEILGYCIKDGHWSVFEQAHMTVEIETTRGIAAQILRHRSFTFQEFSQRYANTNLLGEIPVPDLRSQDLKNRQNSNDDIPEEQTKRLQDQIARYFAEGIDLYNELIREGVAKECARFVLPLATPTRIYMTGSVRSWIHYIDLRSAHGTQKEHMDIVKEVRDIFKKEFPVCTNALNWEYK